MRPDEMISLGKSVLNDGAQSRPALPSISDSLSLPIESQSFLSEQPPFLSSMLPIISPITAESTYTPTSSKDAMARHEGREGIVTLVS